MKLKLIDVAANGNVDYTELLNWLHETGEFKEYIHKGIFGESIDDRYCE